METLWFFVVALMLTVYVVLDGFDLGVGLTMLVRPGTEGERRQLLGAIGPVWDANEVWLIAAGGVLVFAFPAVYASAFSGFYLPLMFVLWLLVFRGISIEFGGHLKHPLWRRFWDATFALSSSILALILGVALGNLLRGVPVDKSGYFHISLFEDFRVGPHPGALDWYTILIGLLTSAALGAHGALYLSWRTEDPLRVRVAAIARTFCMASVALLVLATWATATVQPIIYYRLAQRPWAWPLPVATAFGLLFAFWQLRQRRERAAFLGWAIFVAGLLISTAAGLYPDILRSTLSPSWNLTVANAATGRTGLTLGLWWWIPAIVLASGYFWYLYRSLRGRPIGDQSYH